MSGFVRPVIINFTMFLSWCFIYNICVVLINLLRSFLFVVMITCFYLLCKALLIDTFGRGSEECTLGQSYWCLEGFPRTCPRPNEMIMMLGGVSYGHSHTLNGNQAYIENIIIWW